MKFGRIFFLMSMINPFESMIAYLDILKPIAKPNVELCIFSIFVFEKKLLEKELLSAWIIAIIPSMNLSFLEEAIRVMFFLR